MREVQHDIAARHILLGRGLHIRRDLLDRAAEQLVHVELDRVSPLAVPVMVMIGREATPQGQVDDALLLEAESLASEAMRVEGLVLEP